MKRTTALAMPGRAMRAVLCVSLLILSSAALAQTTGAVTPAPLRFADNGDRTITDKLTGLMWEQAPSTERMNWPHSQEHAAHMTLGGHTDWRLPSLDELTSLVMDDFPNYAGWLNSQGFQNIQPFDYWSSKLLQYMGYMDDDHTYGYVVSMLDGGFNTWLIWSEFNHVWAVRGQPWRGER